MPKEKLLFAYVCLVSLSIGLLNFPLNATALDSVTAKSYLLSHNTTAWSVMGLKALSDNNISLDHLKNIAPLTALDFTAPILAIVSAGEDPKTFTGANLVEGLKSKIVQNQIGDPQALNDDIFGVLALISSGHSASDPEISGPINFIKSNQRSDGGWGFSVAGSSDTNTTATAILALLSAGEQESSLEVQSALAYLKTAQNSDGGFPYDPQSEYGTQSDSSSTAWVMWSMNALNLSPESWSKEGGNPKTFLESLQSPEGFFSYQSDSPEDAFSGPTTAYASIALSGKFLPLKKIPRIQVSSFKFRIEGSVNTICEGSAAGPTVLDIVKNASSICGFTYNISETSFGPYLNQIGSDASAGLLGWSYLINDQLGNVGASEYSLLPNDEVLWFFGEFDLKPTKLTLEPETIGSGQTSVATVLHLSSAGWQPLASAKIFYGTNESNTDSQGKSSLSPLDGYYKVFAEKKGYIRSNSILLKAGEPSSGQVSLKANIGGVEGEDEEPEALGFSVNPGSLDFGTITKGQSSTKTLELKNTGSVTTSFQSVVSGESLFVEGLSLNSASWKNFKTELNSASSTQISAKISVPSDFSQTGTKQGLLIIWAQAK